MISRGNSSLTKQDCIDYARNCRYLNGGGTWYVIRNARNTFNVINSKLYRRKVHGIVVAIIGTA